MSAQEGLLERLVSFLTLFCSSNPPPLSLSHSSSSSVSSLPSVSTLDFTLRGSEEGGSERPSGELMLVSQVNSIFSFSFLNYLFSGFLASLFSSPTTWTTPLGCNEINGLRHCPSSIECLYSN